MWRAHTPENKLEHEVFTVEGEQSLEETERDHAQLQSDRSKESYYALPPILKLHEGIAGSRANWTAV